MAEDEKRIQLPRPINGKSTIVVPSGTSPDDIKEFLKSHGGDFSDKELDQLISTKPPPAASTVNPYVAAAATGLGKSIVGTLASAPFSEPQGLVGSVPYEELPTPQQAIDVVGNKLGGWHQSNSVAEDMAEAGGGMLPAALFAPEALPIKALGPLGRAAAQVPKALAYGFGPGAASELAGQSVSGKSLPESLPLGLGGAPLEPIVRGAVAAGSTPLFRRAITPLPFKGTQADAAARMAATDTLNRAAVKTNPGQNLGYSFPPSNPQEQVDQLTRAYTRLGGHETPSLTTGPQGTLSAMTGTAAQNTADVANRNALDVGVFDPNQRTDFFSALRGVNPAWTPRISNIIQRNFPGWSPNPRGLGPNETLRALMFPGARRMSGQDYQTIHNALGDELTSNLARTNPAYAQALNDTRNTLSQGMETSIYHQNPDDLGAFQNARQTAQNASIIESARNRVGAGPKLSANQIERSGKSQLGKDWNTETQLRPLTESAQSILPQTASTPWWESARLGALGSLAGGMLGYRYGGTEPGVFGLLMGAPLGATSRAAIDAATNKAVNTLPAYFGNTVLQKFPEQAMQRRQSDIVRALMGAGQTPQPEQVQQ